MAMLISSKLQSSFTEVTKVHENMILMTLKDLLALVDVPEDVSIIMFNEKFDQCPRVTLSLS